VGADWKPLNQGCRADFLPAPDLEYGHDPHCVRIHPLKPDRLYQQNHCGIYRMKRAEDRWVRIGENMPKKVGDIGFPIVLHPRDANTVWVFPMDGMLPPPLNPDANLLLRPDPSYVKSNFRAATLPCGFGNVVVQSADLYGIFVKIKSYFHKVSRITPEMMSAAPRTIFSVTRSTPFKKRAVRVKLNRGPVLLMGMTTTTLPRSSA